LRDADTIPLDILAKHLGFAFTGADEPEEQLDSSALTRPVGSQETEDRVLGHAQVELVEDFHAFVGLAQSLRLDDFHIHRFHWFTILRNTWWC
jgi:hypothetical protein